MIFKIDHANFAYGWIYTMSWVISSIKKAGSEITSLKWFPILCKALSFSRIGSQVSLNETTPCTKASAVCTASTPPPIAEGRAMMPRSPAWLTASFKSSLFPSDTDLIFRSNFAALVWFAVSSSNLTTKKNWDDYNTALLSFELTCSPPSPSRASKIFCKVFSAIATCLRGPIRRWPYISNLILVSKVAVNLTVRQLHIENWEETVTDDWIEANHSCSLVALRWRFSTIDFLFSPVKAVISI